MNCWGYEEKALMAAMLPCNAWPTTSGVGDTPPLEAGRALLHTAHL